MGILIAFPKTANARRISHRGDGQGGPAVIVILPSVRIDRTDHATNGKPEGASPGRLRSMPDASI